MSECGILYTSYYAKSKEAKGTRIAISLGIPAWAKQGEHYDEILEAIAPSPKLLGDYKRGEVPEEKYPSIYLKELQYKKKEIKALFDRVRNGETITLLCWENAIEKDGSRKFCHRHVFRKVALKNKIISLEATLTTLTERTGKELYNFIHKEITEFSVSPEEFKEVVRLLSYLKITDIEPIAEINTILIKSTAPISKPKFIISVGGSREFRDMGLLYRTLDDALAERGISKETHDIVIVEGEAGGTDTMAKYYGTERGYTVDPKPADWDNLDAVPCKIKVNKFGKKYNCLAGFNRNKDIIKCGNLVVLFHVNNSPGTADDLSLAKEYDKDLIYVRR